MSFNKARALQEAERSLAQGKFPQAIRQYLEIIENDPSDLILLNTAGDLLARDNSIPEALRLFRRLAEAYVREGFTLRAIAIYKKIIKLDPSTIEPMLKLADLYAGQGLTREARDIYAQALAACQTQNQKEKAIEVMRRLVAAEPANVEHLLRLGECSQAVGRADEALRAYVDAAETALAAGNRDGASRAFDRAAAINPQDSRLDSLRRRLSPVVEPEAQPEGTMEGGGEGGAEEASRPASFALGPGSDHAAEAIPVPEAAQQAPPAAGPAEAVSEAAQQAPPAAGAAEVVIEAAQEAPPAAEAAEPIPVPEAAEQAPSAAGATDVAPVPEATQPTTTLAAEAAEAALIPEAAEQEPPAAWAAETVIEAAQQAPPAAGPAELQDATAEIDLSADWEAVAVSQSIPAAAPEFDFKEIAAEVPLSQSAPAAAPEFDLEESVAEIDFYQEYGLAEERRKALERLETKFPGHPQVAELRRRVEAGAGTPGGSPAAAPPRPNLLADLARDLSAPPGDSQHSGDHPNLLEDLARDLQSSWPGLERTAETQPPAASPAKLDFAASLGALLNQLGAEPGGGMDEDPQAHYQLGIAFREMGLLDEAIGEFQKVVRGAHSGSLPPQYLSSCSLLGVCFRDKLMPELAAKWYQRALEVPGLHPEATLALQYDLGLAYEQAGKLAAARERFLEVYSQNIDYRDVAEKVRLLAASP
jgi:tetratricopeptide (TPR) repeat protein